MNDKETTIQELKDAIKKFQVERNWGQFHDPKNLAEAISIEAGELMEHFLWQDKDTGLEKIKSDPEFKKKVEEELSDVILFCMNFANATGIDIASSAKAKIEKNAQKYPVDKAKGTAKKYTEL